MINYEGIDYNLDTIIQFQALKQLLEALAKKQIDQHIMLYGNNNENILIFNNEANKDNKREEIMNINEQKENKNNDNENDKDKDKVNKNESHENDNKALSNEKEEEIIIKEIKDFGLMKVFIESQKQIIEQKKLIDELNSRIEALEKGKKIIKTKINKEVNTEFNQSNKEPNNKENNKNNEFQENSSSLNNMTKSKDKLNKSGLKNLNINIIPIHNINYQKSKIFGKNNKIKRLIICAVNVKKSIFINSPQVID